MSTLRRVLPLLLVVLVVGAVLVVVRALREKREQADEVALDIRRQLGELDPVTRAAVIARLSAGARTAMSRRRP